MSDKVVVRLYYPFLHGGGNDKIQGRKGENDMRIEAYNQVNQIYQSQKVKKPAKTTKTNRMDQVQISSLGKDIQTLKQAVKDAPDVRSELTAPLKEKIEAGTYNVDAGDFASKLLAKYEAWG